MKEKLKITRGSGNVFLDLGFPPHEAQNLLLRTDLIIEIRRFVRKGRLSQARAARKLGVTQARLNDLKKGRIEKLTIDALVDMLGHAGMRIEMTVKKAA